MTIFFPELSCKAKCMPSPLAFFSEESQTTIVSNACFTSSTVAKLPSAHEQKSLRATDLPGIGSWYLAPVYISPLNDNPFSLKPSIKTFFKLKPSSPINPYFVVQLRPLILFGAMLVKFVPLGTTTACDFRSIGNSIDRPLTTVLSLAFIIKSLQAKTREGDKNRAARTRIAIFFMLFLLGINYEDYSVIIY